MDTQQNLDDFKAVGVDERHAKALLCMLKDALEEKPSTDRLDRMMGEFRLDVHKELAGFRLQIVWLLVASLLSIVVNLALAFWKH